MKRIVSLILCLLLLFTLCVPAMAEEEPVEKKKYVALGDSITAMLNMDYATDSRYPELLAAENDWDMQSFSHNGWRSNEIRIMLEDDYEADTFDKLFLLIYGGSTLQDLQDYREDLRTAIQNADVITLSIGSNDLMGNLIFDILGHILIPQGAGVTTPLQDMVSDTISSIVSFGNDYIHTLLSAEKTFRINWNHIIHDIRALNPNATIVVFGLYNPFGSVNSEIKLPNSILSVVNSFMDSISDYMRHGSPYSREYLFTDISGIDLSGSPDCIHPGPTGHSYIAQQIMTTINDSCKHENVKTLFACQPFLLLPGYTGDTYCADCHELLQRGSLITFTGKHIPLPKTIDIDIFMSAKNVLIDVLKILMDASIAW